MRKVFDGFVLIMAATFDTEVGDIVEFENSIGIAQTSGNTGEKISVDTVGVYQILCNGSDTVNVGSELYYNSTDEEVTTASDSVGDGTGTKYPRAGIAWSIPVFNGEDHIVDVKIG